VTNLTLTFDDAATNTLPTPTRLQHDHQTDQLPRDRRVPDTSPAGPTAMLTWVAGQEPQWHVVIVCAG